MSATEASHSNAEEVTATRAPVPGIKSRYAAKTALSLTLAYLIPFAMGWPQPQTAAITVMLIAATGQLSESLQKGVLRVIGTVVGAVLGLSLIALLPQDRLLYLLLLSVIVSFIYYLYSAYQGDNTLFMLAAVVMLMIFNGGDAEGAFIYGVDRAFMTAFGVLIYTLVASLLWPVKVVDNTREMARNTLDAAAAACRYLVGSDAKNAEQEQALLGELRNRLNALQVHFLQVKHSADGVTDYLPEWNTIVSACEALEDALVPALHGTGHTAIDANHYIANYSGLIVHLESQFATASALLNEETVAWRYEKPPITIDTGAARSLGPGERARVAARADLLRNVFTALESLGSAASCLDGASTKTFEARVPRSNPTFIWRDRDSIRTAVRAFVMFWLATTVWILFNPPGGFVFVAMATLLVPLVSYTPVTPKLLFILFTLGFAVALPAYILLLPQLTHWLQLAAFIFCYAFVGFFVFKGPIAIFFLLGLFTMGLQNTMSYHVDGLLLLIVMFYLICTLLIVVMHLPFTSRPHQLFEQTLESFYRECARTLRHHHRAIRQHKKNRSDLVARGNLLLARLHQWSAMLEPAQASAANQQHIAALNNACDALQVQLQVLVRRSAEFSENAYIQSLHRQQEAPILAPLCTALATQHSAASLPDSGIARESVNARLQAITEGHRNDTAETQQSLATFYVYLNLQAAILDSIHRCYEILGLLNWQQLREKRF
tara:strand:+ start:317864 stop:320026 length:2163 start_codon:yes stop_codon:yes gene_type:complete